MRLAYLVGQYPALPHSYILHEVRVLRSLGFTVEVASISGPDRPAEQLTGIEREEMAGTFYVKSVGAGRALWAQAAVLLTRPVRYLRTLAFSFSLGQGRFRKTLYSLFYFAEAVVFGRWMQSRNLAHVHIHYASTVGLIAARLYPFTAAVTLHGSTEFLDPEGFHLRRKVAASAFVRVISQYGRGELMRSLPYTEWGKIELCRLGIDPVVFSPRPFRAHPSPFEIVSIGRLSAEKGQHVLIAALERLVRQGQDVRLRFLGDGPDRAELERDAAARGLEGQVVFEGAFAHARLPELCAQADVCALTSFREGIPVSLMEAMAMEIPCVAPRITGIPELIEDGADGLLFAPADEEELAAALLRLIGNPDLRRRLGEAARQRVLREYDLAANTARFAEILRRRLFPGHSLARQQHA